MPCDILLRLWEQLLSRASLWRRVVLAGVELFARWVVPAAVSSAEISSRQPPPVDARSMARWSLRCWLPPLVPLDPLDPAVRDGLKGLGGGHHVCGGHAWAGLGGWQGVDGGGERVTSLRDGRHRRVALGKTCRQTRHPAERREQADVTGHLLHSPDLSFLLRVRQLHHETGRGARHGGRAV